MACLTDLPQELLVLIFCAQSRLSDAHSLARCCWRLQHLWRHDEQSFLGMILPRQILCYPEALALLQAQEETMRQEGDCLLSAREITSKQAHGYNRLRQIHRNERITTKMCDAMVKDFIAEGRGIRQDPPCAIHPAQPLEHEVERAICCCYYLQTMFMGRRVMHAVLSLKKDLRTMSIQKLVALHRAMTWMTTIDESYNSRTFCYPYPNQLSMTATESEDYVAGLVRTDSTGGWLGEIWRYVERILSERLGLSNHNIRDWRKVLCDSCSRQGTSSEGSFTNDIWGFSPKDAELSSDAA